MTKVVDGVHDLGKEEGSVRDEGEREGKVVA